MIRCRCQTIAEYNTNKTDGENGGRHFIRSAFGNVGAAANVDASTPINPTEASRSRSTEHIVTAGSAHVCMEQVWARCLSCAAEHLAKIIGA